MKHDVIKKEITKVFEIFKASDCKLRPHFILTGPSGSGKTYIIEALAKEHELNFIEINAAQLTKEGTAGNSLSKALSPLLNYSDTPIICFVDEFDKLFISGNNNNNVAHEVTTGVQNEFLKVLESKTTAVFGDYGKYIEASTNNVLFIFAGAFNGKKDITIDQLRSFGVKTEFIGRVGLIYNIDKFELDQLITILKNSKILKTYLKLFPEAKAKDVIKTITGHLTDTYEKNTIGCRLINTLIHQYFIQGGKLTKTAVKKITFQKTLKLDK